MVKIKGAARAPPRDQRLFLKDWTTFPPRKVGQPELAPPLCTAEPGQVPTALRPTQETRVRAPGARAPEPQSLVVQKEARRAQALLPRRLHPSFPFPSAAHTLPGSFSLPRPSPISSRTTGSFREQLVYTGCRAGNGQRILLELVPQPRPQSGTHPGSLTSELQVTAPTHPEGKPSALPFCHLGNQAFC